MNQTRWVLMAGLVWIGASFVMSCREESKSIRDEGGRAPTTRAVVAEKTDTAAPSEEELRGMGFSFAGAPGSRRSAEEVAKGSASCVACHTGTDSHTMHLSDQGISCVDCHGGNADVVVAAGLSKGDEAYARAQAAAHVKPRVPGLWKTAANPEVSGARTLEESADFIRFVNPGDLRAARAACASCHGEVVRQVERSMMTHGAMLWGAALYNNGSINRKDPVYGESYAPDGTPTRIVQRPAPTTQQALMRGILPTLWPLPRWEVTQPGNILRVFERGGRRRPVLGVPDPLEEPGRPEVKLSVRGYGTDVRTDPVFIGLQKTRLLDPTLNFMGTNDHPGDYRSSGCTACHVVYANDRSPVHSARWSEFGNLGKSATKDPTISKSESGHPIEHKFVRNMPTSQCITCHIHPGTNVVNSYLGYMWWDNESDGEFMYPREQKNPSAAAEARASRHNPEGAAARGLWSNLYPDAENHVGMKAGHDFLERTSELNPQLKHSQFADFHGHGWVFRAVHKRDRKGNLLDAAGAVVGHDDPKKFDKAVHLKDIHLERGMHCVDCHFAADNHGDGNLYGETRNAVVVDCNDCHGTVENEANILRYLKDRRGRDAQTFLRQAFTGAAAPKEPTAEEVTRRRQFIDQRFEERQGRLWQKSALDETKGWFVVQTADGNSPDTVWAKEAGNEKRARAARYAHTIRRDGKTWGSVPAAEEKPELQLAHNSSRMSCYACHTSWNTSCFGCHLPMRANQRKEMLHNEGAITRNYTNYNFQTLRDDIYMLGVDSTVKEHKIVPVRSACAVMVSSQDANRQWLYMQQQTVSAEGYAGTAFSPYFPHTVRATETKQCTDCHVSEAGDNNAVMAQLLLQGTNSVNFVGRWAWVAEGSHGLEGVAVTERDEPQAVIGSRLHELAYPANYRRHVERGMRLEEAHDHHGEVLDVQLRGEYLYAACGDEGFIAYDVANIDNKGFSERIVTAPVSPLGQKFYVRTKYATSVCSPSTMAIDPTRPRRPENEEGKITEIGRPGNVIEKSRAIHPIYAFLYVTDKHEGLVVIGNPWDEKKNRPGVATLLDGIPDNNFLKRAATFNPGGLLKGARHMAFHGVHAYVACDAGVVVLDMNDPLAPRHVTTISEIRGPRRIAFQFRYAFVCDEEGVKVIDVTLPERPKVVAKVQVADARDIYVSRTYGYVAAGHEGVVTLDLERPEKPVIDQVFNDGGKLNDANAVRVGMTNSSMYAYVADGRNGLKVLQLTGADERTPGYMGFSPRPAPRVIAQHKTKGHALAVSEGLDRDRAVDEAGNQLSVFGRRGARPFTLEEQRKLYLRDGVVWTVRDEPGTEPVEGKKVEAVSPETAPATQPAGQRRFPLPRRR